MKKLTVFTAPKSFIDPHISTIQRNAIRSWLAMDDEVQVLLIGSEEGIADVAAEFRVSHVPNVSRNAHGTPLVSSIFQLAHEKSEADLLLFTNTDMLFLPETTDIAFQAKQRAADFVLLGQRYDLDVQRPLDFSPGWSDQLLAAVQERGSLHPLGGSDYFIFPRHLFTWIPDFAIGRAGWDNWMIFHAMKQGWQVVDATHSLVAIHQNHGYGHLDGDRNHQRHPETLENLELAGGMQRMFSLFDVKFQLVDGEVRRSPWSPPRFLHGLERRLQPNELVGRGPRWWLLRAIRKLRRAIQKSEAD